MKAQLARTVYENLAVTGYVATLLDLQSARSYLCLRLLQIRFLLDFLVQSFHSSADLQSL